MKASEFRLGNYISTLKNNGNWETKQISKGAELDFIKDNNYDFHIYKPIPLTNEWAVKFGYECLVEMAFDFSSESKFDIEITSEDLIKLKVHEAQNLFHSLTGEELTIKEIA